jgi:hypothetical protein
MVKASVSEEFVLVGKSNPRGGQYVPYSVVERVFLAVRENNSQKLEKLLQKHPLAANAKNTKGETPLLVAVSCDASDCVFVLVNDYNADPLCKDKESQWNALHRAVYHGSLCSAQVLFKVCGGSKSGELRKGSAWKKLVVAQDNEGLTPFQLFQARTERQSLLWKKKELTVDVREEYGTMWNFIDEQEEKGVSSNVTLDRFGIEYEQQSCLLSFGSSANFQLGYPLHAHVQLVPRPLPNLKMQNVIKVVYNKYSVGALTSDGKLYTWGCGQSGRLGLGHCSTTIKAELVSRLKDEFIVDVSIGEDCSLAVTLRGIVFGWGEGLASFMEESVVRSGGNNLLQSFHFPRVIESVRNQKISCARVSRDRLFFLTTSGSLCILGWSLRKDERFLRAPKFILDFENSGICEIKTLDRAILVQTTKGRMLQYSFEQSRFRRVSFPFENERNDRVVYRGTTERIVSFDCCDEFAIASSNLGRVYAWNIAKQELEAKRVISAVNLSVKSVSCSNSFCSMVSGICCD